MIFTCSKETEAVTKLKEVQELAKAELAAAIASEKASQIKKMAEANLHVCMTVVRANNSTVIRIKS